MEPWHTICNMPQMRAVGYVITKHIPMRPWDGRAIPVGELKDAHLENITKRHIKVFRKTDGELLAELDTVQALRACLAEMQRRGMKLPKRAPSSEELDEACHG